MGQIRVIAGRFEVERAVASGGMGAIYRARDRVSGGPVALKLLLGLDPGAIERFAREGRVIAALSHPAIVRYVTHGTTADGEPYLAMEWLEGEDLSSRLARGRVDLEDAISLVRRVAGALAAAHASGITHRDVKPANLFLEGGALDRVKLVDFGIARVSSATRTATGITLGTPGYMAPEQVSGNGETGAPADVFALGGVLFECIAGRPAFVAEHVMALLAKILFEEAPRLRDVDSEVPAWLDDLVARMLAKDPKERPADGAAVADELARGAPSTGRPPRSSSARLAGDETAIASVVLATCGVVEAAPTMEVGLSAVSGPNVGGVVRLAGRVMLSSELERAIAALGGEIEALPDGTVVVAVRAAGAATDRAAQAARCALALRLELVDAPIAVATGRAAAPAARGGGAVASEGAGRSRARPFGEAIDRAAALLRGGSAERTIVVDDATAGLLDARFEVAETSRGHELLGERELVEEARTLLGKPTPCVGRERELGLLDDMLQESASERRAATVIVTAPPGMGKSRLRCEFVRRSRLAPTPPSVWIARGDPLRSGSPFALLASLVCSAAGISEGAAIAERRRSLRARLALHLGGDVLARTLAFLGELIGAPVAAGENAEIDAARNDGKLMGGQMRRAWETLVRAATESAVLLVVVEDVHWADPPTVDFLDGALRSAWDRPLLLLALGRPETRELHPSLAQAKGAQEIRLGELGRRVSEGLVRAALGDGVDAAAVSRIIDRAGGNAFYLEELVRAVAERTRGHEDDDLAAWADVALPETVLAMVEARLMRLPPDARRVLRAASVMGERFWRGAVGSLVGGDDAPLDVDAWLHRLAVEEVIAPRTESRFSGEAEFAFRHALLRDGAYAMLSDADRVLGHRLVGAWLAGAGEPEASVVATHFDRGEDRDSAIVWLLRAVQQASKRNDLSAAMKATSRAIELGADGETLAEILAARARAFESVARWRDARADFEAALALLPPERIERRAEIRLALALVCYWLADGEAVGEHASDALELATRARRHDLRQQTLGALALAHTSVGRVAESLTVIRQIGPIGDLVSAVVALCGQGFYMSGFFAEADLHNRQCIAAARRAGDSAILCLLLQAQSLVLGALGQAGEAQRVVAESVAIAEAHGIKPLRARALTISGGLAWDAFDAETAEVRATLAREACQQAPFPPGEMMTTIDLARCAIERRDLRTATELVERAAVLVVQSRGVHIYTGGVRLAVARAELALLRSDKDAALALADEAIDAGLAILRPKYEIHARIARSRALEELGRRGDAIVELRRAWSVAERMQEPSMLMRVAARLLAHGPDAALAARAREAASAIAASLDGEARARFEAADVPRAILGAALDSHAVASATTS